MAKVDEKQVAVARVYSGSMLDLATPEGQAETLLEEMEGLLSLMEDNESFRHFLTSPLVKSGDRERILEEQLRGKLSDLLVNSLQVLNKHERLEIFETLVAVYRDEYQERDGQIDVHVTTAVPLTDSLREEISAAASRIEGRKPNLITSVDPGLIAGLVVKIGDRKIDTSVATGLRNLKQTLSDRASQEIHASRVDSAE